ncbi:beta-lactamase family protein [Microbispora cellulosiformans]|uniref:Beta-lactamase family protein n=1 Tax=Microbispora cellulosiformans TaxID=2614688 RepID=A0A5J5JWR8_9ACTN|nr:serine hydrolase domain-containing protein [Microbispora cellulosiformans]KAA9374557.1 beta-lactamase family protein [Microbispora cellulosiformans]
MDSDSVRDVGRRQLVKWSGLAAAGVAAAGVPSPATPPRPDRPGSDRSDPGDRGDRIPPDTLPGGAYDRYVARLAAEGRFSGVVLLSHRGRTVLSRAYGMADEKRRIRNREDTAFALSSAGKPFHAVAVLQLAQQGKLKLTDTVGAHLTGFAEDIADQVTIHHLLSGTSGLDMPKEDVQRVFQSRSEVHEYHERRVRQARLTGVPGLPSTGHQEAEATIPALIVEAVSGTTYWDYVQENIFRRCGMTGSAFHTRPQWITGGNIAHPYMEVAGGGVVDALSNLDKGSPYPYILGKNPGRAFIDAPGDGGFATAPDLVRFARALSDGTVLDRPWADVLTAAKAPHGQASFAAYGIATDIVEGQWAYQRSGGNPGIGANWSIYPDTGWVGVILANHDSAPLVDIIGQELSAVTGASPGGGTGG